MKPALVLIDFQNDFLAAPNLQPAAGQVMDQAAALLAACRAGGIPVIHVWTTVQRQPDNRMPHWKAAGLWMCEKGTPGHEVPPSLRPASGETIIHKQFFSGFANGELDRILRQQKCDTLLLAGVHLHGCVRATAFDAYERGYQVNVADDAVASNDPLHSAITRRYLSKRSIKFSPGAMLLRRISQQKHVETVPASIAENISRTTSAANQTFQSWRKTDIQQRAEGLRRLATLLTGKTADLAQQITKKIGKPITMARAEVTRSAAILHAVADQAAQPLETRSGPDARYRYQPLGVVAILTPWNNPLAIPIGKIAPALLYGNTVVWKPAPAGAAIAHALLELGRAAGWHIDGEDVLHLITGDAGTAALLAEDQHIDGVTVSGSPQAGVALHEICARRHIPFQAELGGNNAAIVWDDADLPDAANQIVGGAFGFAGQRCTANRRVIVAHTCFEQFMHYLRQSTIDLTWGDPWNEQTCVGPLLNIAKRDQVSALLQRARQDGHQIFVPHEQQSNYADLMQRGPYHPPAIVVCDHPAHEIVQEETFGPVLVVQRAENFEQALALCNGVRQGLVAALFSASPALQQQFLAQAQAGILKLNRSTVDADAASPLGGWKASGSGPAEHGPSDREFFCRVQTIYGS